MSARPATLAFSLVVGAMVLISIFAVAYFAANGAAFVVVLSLFLLAGAALVGFVVLGVRISKSHAAERRIRRSHPDEPWLHRRDWREKKIRDGNRTELILWGVFAGIWNGVTWPMLIGLILSGSLAEEGIMAVLFVGIFVLAGVGMIAGFAYALLRWRRFGASVFEAAELPGVVGGTLGGLVRTKVNLAPSGGFKVRLRCVNRITTGAGKSRSTREVTLWEDETVVARDALEADRTQSAIPIYFEIPPGAKPTSAVASNNMILWKLSVEADLPGIDYRAGFEVPVFWTAASRTDFVAVARGGAGSPERQRSRAEWRAEGVEMLTAERGYLHFRNCLGRQRMISGVPLAIGLVLWIVAWAMHTRTDAPGVMPLFGAVIGAVFVVAGAIGWTRRIEVVAGGRGLTLESRLLWRIRRREIAPEKVREIRLEPGTQIGSNQHYRLTLVLADGTTEKIPHDLKSYAGGRELAALMASALGHTGLASGLAPVATSP